MRPSSRTGSGAPGWFASQGSATSLRSKRRPNSTAPCFRSSKSNFPAVTERLARACLRHPWRVIGLWIVVIVASFFAIATMLAYEGEIELTRETESGRALEVLAEGFSETRADQERFIS